MEMKMGRKLRLLNYIVKAKKFSYEVEEVEENKQINERHTAEETK